MCPVRDVRKDARTDKLTSENSREPECRALLVVYYTIPRKKRTEAKPRLILVRHGFQNNQDRVVLSQRR